MILIKINKERFEAELSRKGLSKTALLRKTGLSMTVMNYINHSKDVRCSTVEKIAEVLSVSVPYLIDTDLDSNADTASQTDDTTKNEYLAFRQATLDGISRLDKLFKII